MFQMDAESNFIQRRFLTDFTGYPHADLLNFMFICGYNAVRSFGRAGAREQASSGLLSSHLRTLIPIENQLNFPWLLADIELNAIGVMLVENIDDLLSQRVIVSYAPLPFTLLPSAMMIEVTNEY